MTYIIVAGKVGMNIACTSFCDTFRISITADDVMYKEAQYLADLVEKNITTELKKYGITWENALDLLE